MQQGRDHGMAFPFYGPHRPRPVILCDPHHSLRKFSFSCLLEDLFPAPSILSWTFVPRCWNASLWPTPEGRSPRGGSPGTGVLTGCLLLSPCGVMHGAHRRNHAAVSRWNRFRGHIACLAFQSARIVPCVACVETSSMRTFTRRFGPGIAPAARTWM